MIFLNGFLFLALQTVTFTLLFKHFKLRYVYNVIIVSKCSIFRIQTVQNLSVNTARISSILNHDHNGTSLKKSDLKGKIDLE